MRTLTKFALLTLRYGWESIRRQLDDSRALQIARMQWRAQRVLFHSLLVPRLTLCFPGDGRMYDNSRWEKIQSGEAQGCFLFSGDLTFLSQSPPTAFVICSGACVFSCALGLSSLASGDPQFMTIPKSRALAHPFSSLVSSGSVARFFMKTQKKVKTRKKPRFFFVYFFAWFFLYPH